MLRNDSGILLSNAGQQPKVQTQTSVLGLGVDFVSPLSQQEQEEPPTPNLSEGGVLQVCYLTHKLLFIFHF